MNEINSFRTMKNESNTTAEYFECVTKQWHTVNVVILALWPDIYSSFYSNEPTKCPMTIDTILCF